MGRIVVANPERVFIVGALSFNLAQSSCLATSFNGATAAWFNPPQLKISGDFGIKGSRDQILDLRNRAAGP